MISVENNQECFVLLWRKLERTRQLLWTQNKRFCIRRILQSWFGLEATDDLIWEVCHNRRRRRARQVGMIWRFFCVYHFV